MARAKPREQIFVDSSAFKGLVDFDDEVHEEASGFWEKVEQEGLSPITTNFVLDETYTLLRKRKGKAIAIKFKKDLAESLGVLDVVRVTLRDEGGAWKFFKELPGRGVSYTDCTSFAVMQRLGLTEAFTFDRDFRKAGIKVLP